MIPSTIHQIWIGPKKRPQKWMDSWKLNNPNFSIKIWDQKSIDEFNLINIEKYNYFIGKSIYDGASDIARVEILERYGGIYLDADLICLSSIENEDFIKKDFFACFEYNRRISNAVIGSTPHHPIMVEYLSQLSEARVVEPPCYTVGGTMLTTCVDMFICKNSNENIEILPSYCFFPNWKNIENIKGKILARHMWGTARKIY